ncbi:HAD family hydrolase [Salidesulfovibrio onnuriiensis]|uniref:HAD family hydrolase n=1 Tax=Salidesulfovibrio onnuriiensis TaxID=2583823 RepID=UPI0011CB3E73|nr:HAD family hydrolase [Salidesulfovibrio onnuriiensis]
MIQAVVFDCDGVLLESVEVKARAFEYVFAEYGAEATAMIRDYHRDNGGISRQRKFAYFYEKWLGRGITPEESEALNRRFTEYCLESVLGSPMVPGARECLERLHGTLPMWVASGAPQDELRMILARRGLDRYFEDVFGSPDTKDVILRRIIQMNRLAPERVLMVGDSSTDLEAAESVGCRFYGRGRFEGHPWAEDLVPLAGHVLGAMA